MLKWENWGMWLFFVLIAAFIAGMVILIVWQQRNFDANCLKWHTETTYQLVGKIIVPVKSRFCDLWRHP